MSGAKGRSGGPRRNAGRPPITRTLRTGMKLLVHQHDAQGCLTEMGSLVEVQIHSRTLLVLRYEDGREISIGY